MDFPEATGGKNIHGMETGNMNDELGGVALLAEVVEKTGLAGNLIESELSSIVENAGHSASNITLDQLRAAMLNYLEELNLNLQEDESTDEAHAAVSDAGC